MDLYIDGNIAQTFSPEGATRYFARLLGVDVRSLRYTVSQEPPHAFFVTDLPTVQNARPHLVINGRPLDYAITQAGTVVPQRMWSPGNPTNVQRISNLSLNVPIFFLHNDRMTLGLPLPRAIEGDRTTLLEAGDTAPIGNCSTMCIRISVRTFSHRTVERLCSRVALLRFVSVAWLR